MMPSIRLSIGLYMDYLPRMWTYYMGPERQNYDLAASNEYDI